MKNYLVRLQQGLGLKDMSKSYFSSEDRLWTMERRQLCVGGMVVVGLHLEVGGNSHIETDRIQLPLHQGDPRWGTELVFQQTPEEPTKD